MTSKERILIGGGGHCRACIDVIESAGIFKIAGIVGQPGKDKLKSILGYPIIGDDDQFATLKKRYDYVLITVGQIGSSSIRQNIFFVGLLLIYLMI